MTLQIADCRLKIHGLTIDGLTIEGLTIGSLPVTLSGCSCAGANRQSSIGNPAIFSLQSSVGNDVWAS
jgi:hypothetical protein